jgi:hypothetical protein
MSAIRFLLALAALMVAALVSFAVPEPPVPAVPRPLPFPGQDQTIPERETFEPERLGSPASASARLPLPEDWPRLDPVNAGGTLDETQTMATGDLDLVLDGTTTSEICDDPQPPRSVLDEFEQQPEIAEARKRREEARQRREAEAEDEQRRSLEEFALTDEERAAREEQRKREEEEYDTLITEIDEEIDKGCGPFAAPPPALEPNAVDEPAPAPEPPPAPDAEAQPPAPPKTGYQLSTPDGKPIERVVVGQPINVELRVTPEEASIPGRQGGTRELEFIEVTLISEEGEEQTIRLWRAEQPSSDGLIRFVSKEPVSIAARVNGNPLPGTLEGLDLDLRGKEGSPEELSETIRIRSGQEVRGGFSTFELYGKPITAALAEIKNAIDVVEEQLQNERRFVVELIDDAAGDEEVLTDLRGWLERIDDQLLVLKEARQLAEYEYNEEYQLVLSSKLLQTVIVQGPDGWEIVETDPLRSGSGNLLGTEDLLFWERKRLDEKYKGRAIVQRAAFDTIEQYLLTSYSQFAHITLGAPAFTVLTGLDEFGKQASRVWALVEIGTGVATIVVAIKLPGSIASYVDEGRLLPSKDLEYLSTARQGGRPGRLGETRVYEGTPQRPVRSLPGETPRAPRTPGAGGQGRAVIDAEGNVRYGAGVESAGGRLTPGRRGLDAEDVRMWRQRESPQSREGIELVNEKLGIMDEALAKARERGVPEDVIQGILAETRRVDPDLGPVHSLGSAEQFVTTRLEWEIAARSQERIVLSTAERQELVFNSTLPDAAATPQHLARAEVVDKLTLESVVTKSQLEAGGKPQVWTVEEIEYGRSIVRRLEAGEDVSSWKTVDLDEGPGLRPIFASDDLGAIRSTFTGRPLRIGTETPAAPRRPQPGRPAPERTPAVDEAPNVEPAPGRVDPTERLDPADRAAAAEDAMPTQGPPETPARTERPDPADRVAAAEDVTPTQRLDPTERIDPTERLVDPDAPTERIDPTERLVDPDALTERIDPVAAVEAGVRTGPRQPADFIADDPAGFLRSFYGDDAASARAYEIAIRELGPENVHGIAGSYAKGNPRVRSWPDDIVYIDARRLDKLTTDIPPTILERLPARVQELHTRLREMGGGDGLPSDLDVAVSQSVEIKTLEAVGAKIFEETGVLVEFTPGARPVASRLSPDPARPTPAALDPALDPTAVGGPSGRAAAAPRPEPVSPGGGWREETGVDPAHDGSSPVEILIQSRGGSTGPVLEMLSLNYGHPVVIRTGRLILEPLEDPDAETRIRIAQIRTGARTSAPVPAAYAAGGGAGPPRLPGGRALSSVVPLVLEGFCLQLQRAVPEAGTVYRIADRAIQESGTPVEAILDAGRLLQDLGGLHPDTDPADYFHSIRQWAIWVHEEGLDRDAFEAEFVEHVRRTFEAADHEWTPDVERRLHEFIPNRWNDVVAILEVAGHPVSETAQ